MSMRKDFEKERTKMEEHFAERLNHVKEEFAKELQISKHELTEKHKIQYAQLKAEVQKEKDDAIQELVDRQRKRLEAAEEQMHDIHISHQRDLDDLRATFDIEKTTMDKRDIQNVQEIEQLHRKCRALTNLFDEMRLRYERREPRQEDIREIDELRMRCDSQERDMFLLTEKLREMQMKMESLEINDIEGSSPKKATATSKQVKKPPPKSIPTNCDVIYEENEERDSPPPASASLSNLTDNDNIVNGNCDLYNDDDESPADESRMTSAV